MSRPMVIQPPNKTKARPMLKACAAKTIVSAFLFAIVFLVLAQEEVGQVECDNVCSPQSAQQLGRAIGKRRWLTELMEANSGFWHQAPSRWKSSRCSISSQTCTFSSSLVGRLARTCQQSFRCLTLRYVLRSCNACAPLVAEIRNEIVMFGRFR